MFDILTVQSMENLLLFPPSRNILVQYSDGANDQSKEITVRSSGGINGCSSSVVSVHSFIPVKDLDLRVLI